MDDEGRGPDPTRAIERLLYDYADRADELDAAGIATLLVNAELRSRDGWSVVGGEAIERHLVRLFATASTSRHVITNVRVDVDVDDGVEVGGARTATSSALYTKWVIDHADDNGPVVDSAGRYLSGFQLVGGCWKFTFHQVETSWRRKT
jgi:hypothetical protein